MDYQFLNNLSQNISKHSQYQEVFPKLKELFDIKYRPKNKKETQRFAHFKSLVEFKDSNVLDIGANLGFFSMAALDLGANAVTAYEPDLKMSMFIELSAEMLGYKNRTHVRRELFDFNKTRNYKYDIILCLNVLHHIGDDFCDKNLSIHNAKNRIIEYIQNISNVGGECLFQIGYNWKGNADLPLFENGTKTEMINFVIEACKGYWEIEMISIFNPISKNYESINTFLLNRFEFIGEFYNRPIFFLRNKKYTTKESK
jgi:hypothetical protein